MAKKYKDVIILLLVYLATRLPFLTRYPIFNDESTYLRYGIVMTTVPWERWYSMAHTGKQPLLFWMYGILTQLISNPLVAGRLVSVFIGIFTVIAIYRIGKSLGSKSLAHLAVLFYIFTPLFVFFDRLALVDNALAAVFAWILCIFIKAYPRYSVKHSIYVGALVGLSFWLKSTAVLFGCVVFILFLFAWIKNKKAFSLLLSLLTFIVTVWIVIIPLFLRPQAEMMIKMASEYSYSPQQVITLGFGNVPQNLINTILVYLGYVSPVFAVAAVITGVVVKKAKVQMLLVAWASALFVLLTFGIQIHSRYLLFTAAPLILLAAVTLQRFKVVTDIAIGIIVLLSTALVVNPPLFFASFPKMGIFAKEQNQYISGWSSGYGVKEAFDAVNNDRKGKPVTIAVRWDTGNPEDAMFVYGYNNKGIQVRYMDQRLPEEAKQIIESSNNQNIYFVTRKGVYEVFKPFLIPFTSFGKPNSSERVEVFRVVL